MTMSNSNDRNHMNIHTHLCSDCGGYVNRQAPSTDVKNAHGFGEVTRQYLDRDASTSRPDMTVLTPRAVSEREHDNLDVSLF